VDVAMASPINASRHNRIRNPHFNRQDGNKIFKDTYRAQKAAFGLYVEETRAPCHISVKDNAPSCAGHFALDTKADEIAALVSAFMAAQKR
jgi:hypothetical protein